MRALDGAKVFVWLWCGAPMWPARLWWDNNSAPIPDKRERAPCVGAPRGRARGTGHDGGEAWAWAGLRARLGGAGVVLQEAGPRRQEVRTGANALREGAAGGALLRGSRLAQEGAGAGRGQERALGGA